MIFFPESVSLLLGFGKFKKTSLRRTNDELVGRLKLLVEIGAVMDKKSCVSSSAPISVSIGGGEGGERRSLEEEMVQ